jgi:phospholipid/cholesterol/gamma-HCH transport system ATP-binding protein
MIEVSELNVSYDDMQILKGTSFSINPGERVSIVGPGGSGKTTILKAICGLIPVEKGSATVFNQNMEEASGLERHAFMKRIGVAFQQGGLFDFMSVKENLEFAMSHMTEATKAEQEAVIDKLLDAVKLMRTKNMFPYELSGGMQRRVGLARAMCTDPEIALFDEPTAGLDPVTSTIILNMIGQLGGIENKKTLVIATSNVEIAVRFARRLILIQDGKVHADGDWAELLTHGDEWTKYFLSVRFMGLSKAYLSGLSLPAEFIEAHGI